MTVNPLAPHRKSLWLVLLTALLGLSQLAWAPPEENFSAFAKAAEENSAQQPAEDLKRLLDAGLPVEMEPAVGQPTFLWLGQGWVSAPKGSVKGPVEVARRHLEVLGGLYGLTSSQVRGFEARLAHDTGFGNLIVVFEQRVNGFKVHGHRMSMMLERGTLTPVALSGYLFDGFQASEPHDLRLVHDIPMAVAIAEAVVDRHGVGLDPAMIKPTGRLHGGYTYHDLEPPAVMSIGPDAQVMPVRIKPVLYGLPDGLEAAYYLELLSSEGQAPVSTWAYIISARDGRLLERTLLDFDFDFTVWADVEDGWPQDSPLGSALTPLPPDASDALLSDYVEPVTINMPTGFNSFEDPWLAPDSGETFGNNVDAFADLVNGQNNARFNDGDLRGVVSEPSIFGHVYDPFAEPAANDTQLQADIQQLFYVNNYLHDVFYDRGFDEAAGNAQDDNYGRGGVGGDRMIAKAQSFTGTNNATMSTPADGAPPLMTMFNWDRNSQVRRVTAPGLSFSGSQLGTATFNPAGNFELAAPLRFGVDDTAPNNDGCQPLTNDLTGQIAVVDRGECNFVVKVANAQNAGAVGVLIVNNRGGVTTMNGDPPQELTIPTLMVLESSRGALLENEGEQATLLIERTAVRGSSMDINIIAHEWGHYLFGRLVPTVSANQTRGINEGNSDFVALLMAAREGDVELPGNERWQGRFPMASYADKDAVFGIRRVPYSTDPTINGLTFANIDNANALSNTFEFRPNGNPNAQVHNTGEVWASSMWGVFVELLARHPFEEARTRMMEYLVAGLKMAPANTTFTELRDAIVAAMSADPDDFAAGWRAFARRGLGTGAVSPPRNDGNNSGAVESFELLKEIVVLDVTLLEDEPNCDGDGVLDVGEWGVVVVELANASPIGIDDAQVTLGASPGLLFPEGQTVQVPTLTPTARAAVTLPVRLADFEPFSTLTLTVEVNAEGLEEPVQGAGSVDVLVDYDERFNNSASDDVEAPTSAWTVSFDEGRARPVPAERVERPNADNHVWYLPAAGAGITDQYLTSPPLDVAEEGDFVFGFTHTYQFESTDGTHYDAAVLELSVDGQQWVDIGEFADPGYNGQVTDLGEQANPLANRQAWIDRNPSHPESDRVTVNLGDQFQGQTVQVRLRVGTDPAVGGEGWFVDDFEFENLTNTPFTTIGPHDTECPSSPPVADAGDDFAVGSGLRTALDGGASADPWGQAVTFEWVQLDGPEVALVGADSPRPSLTAPVVFENTPLTFSLTVTAEDGRVSEPDTVVVTVQRDNNAPVADAGPDVEVDEGDTVALDGGGSADADDDPLTFVWSQLDGPAVSLSDPNSPNPELTAPEVSEDTVARLQLIVSDGISLSEPDVVEVLIRHINQPPVADAGPDQTVDPGALVTLDGGGSADPDGDALSHAWTQVEGPEVELDDATAAQPTFTAPSVRTGVVLRFSLTVNDGALSSEADEVDVRVLGANATPVADAGPDVEVDEGDTVALDGGGSADADDDPLTFVWSQLDGPAVSLSDPNSPNPELTAPEVSEDTVARLQLIVSDGELLSEPDVVEVLIRHINQPPVADAGPDQTVDPGALVTLDGGGSADPDGDALSHAWTQVEGPEVELDDATAAQPTFTAPDVHLTTLLRFELSVGDGVLDSEVDEVTIRVLGANAPPVADAGPDNEIDENGSISLDGSGSSDPDGDELTFIWSQLDGPPVSLSDPNVPRPLMTAPEVDEDTTVRLQLIVSDGSLTSEPDVVAVQIFQVNRPPVADARAVQRVNAGDTVVLDAAASVDPEGQALTFVWTQVQGESVDLEGGAEAKASFVAPTLTEEATLVFEVEVADPQGATDTAQLTLVVEATPLISVGGSRDGGCSVSAASSSQSAPQWLLLLFGLLALRRRR